MARNLPPTDTAGTPEPDGVVSGAVLRAIRTQLALTQDRTAELLTADPATIKSWETGRRPLARVPVQRLRQVTRALARLGANPAMLAQLDTAIDVDLGIGAMLAHDGPPTDHPLATWVHTKQWHDLLAWAIAGTTPKVLCSQPNIPRPRLAVPDRERLLNQLRATAEQADGNTDAASTLLRRQVYFVASWDTTGPGRDWLHRMERQELRRLRTNDGWTPSWVASRSLAVAKAVSGDPAQLQHFIERQLADDSQEIANLRYWALWCGEDTQDAISDEFMSAQDLGAWRGTTLLRHLIAGLTPATAYVALTIHTVWALLERRPWLLDDDPHLTADLRERVERLLQSDQPGSQARRELDQIFYATKMRGRP